MTGYPLDRLYEEMAFLAYYLHWDQETLLQLEHRDRQRWCEEVSRINRRIAGETRGERSLLDL